MKKEWSIQIISTLLIILWVYAAGSKLTSYTAFASQLVRQPLPSWSLPIIQWLLPAVELFVVVLLCNQKTIIKGFILSFSLLIIFTLYVGFGLAHIFNQVPCSCGGILNHASWTEHLVFNLFFTLISFIGWQQIRHKHDNKGNEQNKNNKLSPVKGSG